MREIKFRAWDGKLMYQNVVIVDGKAFKNEKSAGSPMQFTGLKDKNNKEIYEGDIVESFHRIYDGGKVRRNVVEFNNFCWRLVSIGDDMVANAPLGLYAGDQSVIMVIGNIYETPELAVMDS